MQMDGKMGGEQITINKTPAQSKASAKKPARKIDEDDYDKSDEDDSSNVSQRKCSWTGRHVLLESGVSRGRQVGRRSSRLDSQLQYSCSMTLWPSMMGPQKDKYLVLVRNSIEYYTNPIGALS